VSRGASEEARWLCAVVQALLDQEYVRAAAEVKANTGLDAFVAPAGPAWQLVFDQAPNTTTGVHEGEAPLHVFRNVPVVCASAASKAVAATLVIFEML